MHVAHVASYANLQTRYTAHILLTQLCLRALLRPTPSPSGAEAILKMGHGGNMVANRLGVAGSASLTHVSSQFRLLPLDLLAISDEALQRQLRGPLRVELRVTATGSISQTPAVIAASLALKESQPWRPVDAATFDAHSRRMAADANPYGRPGVLAPPDALAYCLRICRVGERFEKFAPRGAEAVAEPAVDASIPVASGPVAATEAGAAAVAGSPHLPRPPLAMLMQNSPDKRSPAPGLRDPQHGKRQRAA